MMSAQTVHAVDLPSSVAFTQTHSFEGGFKIEVTAAIVDEKDDDEWIKYFKKDLEEDFKENPNLKSFFEGIESDEGSSTISRSTSSIKRINDFISKVAHSKSIVKFERFVTGKSYREWKEKHKSFFEKNKVRINATRFRFIFNTTVIASALIASDDPVIALAAIAGATLTGALSASTAWWFELIKNFVQPRLTNYLADKSENTKLSQAMDKLRLSFLKRKVYKAASWVEESFMWGVVELGFLGIVKIGFVMLGLEEAGDFSSDALTLLINAGLGTISQGEWERSIFSYHKQMTAANVDSETIQKRSQYLALAGSVLAVFGTVSNILDIQMLGYSPGTAVLISLGVGGVVHRLVRIHETKLIELGKTIANKCAKKLEKKKKESSGTDQSNNWVISPVQCSV